MAPDRNDQLRAAALAALGPADFDRLIWSVFSSRRLRRLEDWQEELLARVPGDTIGLEEFITAFDDPYSQLPPAPAPAQTEGTGSLPDSTEDASAWLREGREMNEAEWLAESHLKSLVQFLISRGDDRRHLLFGCACCRQVRHLLQHEAGWKLVEQCEAFADGDISEADFKAGADPELFADLVPHYRGLGGPGQLSVRALCAIGAARRLASDRFRKSSGATAIAWETSTQAQGDFIPTPQRPFIPHGGSILIDQEQFREKAKLLRDIFGNPFRPVAFAPSWRTNTAVALARRMYQSRDFSAMPILADALEVAGCDSAEVLGHCRGPGPHARGCHVVDLVLGKP
jgi:hypothetical protein